MYDYDEDSISLTDLPTLGGHNEFINNKWDVYKWSAPYIQDPAVLEQYVYSLGLVGATLYEVAIVGDDLGDLGGIGGLSADLFYPHLTYSNGFERYEPTDIDWVKKRLFSQHWAFVFNQCQPVILLTDRGAFEIFYTDSSTVFMSKNTLPPSMYDSDERVMPSYDIRQAFRAVNMRKIIAFNIITQPLDDALAYFCGTYGIELPENQQGYIKEIQFILDNGLRLVMESEYDWGNIGFKSMKNKWLDFDRRQIEKLLKVGIYQWHPKLKARYMNLFEPSDDSKDFL